MNTYSSLKTSIANFSHRSDLTSYLDDFIDLAEARVANDVRCRAMFDRYTASISTEYFDTPTNLLEVKSIFIQGSPDQPLQYLSPMVMEEKFPSSTTGKPRFYTIHGDEIQVKPIPSTSYTIEIDGYFRFTALDDTNTSTWLTTNHPQIMLYATLIEVGVFLEDDNMIQKYTSLYDSAVDKLNSAERNHNHGANLVARVNTATP